MGQALSTTERRKRFETQVKAAERQIKDAPDGYKFKIVLLACLGYAVIFGMLALLVGLVGGLAWIAFASTALLLFLLKKELIIVVLLAIWLLAKALWVRFNRPEGKRLTAAQAPALFAEVESLRQTLALPKIHEVLLTAEFNAAMAQSPRLGVFGWQRNALILGLPLLLGMTAGEARAVIAHEAGHLSGNHSRFHGWSYRVRLTWYRIMDAFGESEGFAAGLLRRFFSWYTPYFSSLTFVLARANEYQADAISAMVTSKNAVASALIGSHIRADIADDAYWPPLLVQADHNLTPESQPFTGLAHFFHQHRVPPGELKERLDRALSDTTALQ